MTLDDPSQVTSLSSVGVVQEFEYLDGLADQEQRDAVLELGFSEGLYLDMLGVAATRQLPLSQVVSRQLGSQEFFALADQLQQTQGDDILAVRWREGYGEFWIPAGKSGQIESLVAGTAAVLIESDIPSEAERTRETEDAAAALSELGVDDYALSYDLDVGALILDTTADTAAKYANEIRRVLGEHAIVRITETGQPEARGGRA